MINDLDKSYALELQRTVNPILKSWADVSRTVEKWYPISLKEKLWPGTHCNFGSLSTHATSEV